VKGTVIFRDKTTGERLVLDRQLRGYDDDGNQLDMDSIRELVRRAKEKGKIIDFKFFQDGKKTMITLEW
jgi:hypothetical protein